MAGVFQISKGACLVNWISWPMRLNWVYSWGLYRQSAPLASWLRTSGLCGSLNTARIWYKRDTTKYVWWDVIHRFLDLQFPWQYRGSVFKVPMLTHWIIVVTSQQLIDDIRRASDDQLSLKDAVGEVTQLAFSHNLPLIYPYCASFSILIFCLTMKCTMTIFTPMS